MSYQEDPINPELNLLSELTKELFSRLQSNRDTLGKLKKQSETVGKKESLKCQKLQEATERHEETFQSLGTDFNGMSLGMSVFQGSDVLSELQSEEAGAAAKEGSSAKTQGLNTGDDVFERQSLDKSGNPKEIFHQDKEERHEHELDESQAQLDSIINDYNRSPEQDHSKSSKQALAKDTNSAAAADSNTNIDADLDIDDEHNGKKQHPSPLFLSQKENISNSHINTSIPLNRHRQDLNEGDISSENLRLRVELQRLEVIEQKITEVLGKFDMAAQNVCDGARAYLREYSHASQSLVYSYEGRLHEEKMLQERLLTTKDGMLTELNSIKSLTMQANGKMLRNLMTKADKINDTSVISVDQVEKFRSSGNNDKDKNENQKDANKNKDNQTKSDSSADSDENDDEDRLCEKDPNEGVPSLIKYQSQIQFP